MADEADQQLISCKLECQKCGLIILKPNVAKSRKLDGFLLPDHTGEPILTEEFAMVDDIYAFENIGFLRPVDDKKVGPI